MRLDRVGRHIEGSGGPTPDRVAPTSLPAPCGRGCQPLLRLVLPAPSEVGFLFVPAPSQPLLDVPSRGVCQLRCDLFSLVSFTTDRAVRPRRLTASPFALLFPSAPPSGEARPTSPPRIQLGSACITRCERTRATLARPLESQHGPTKTHSTSVPKKVPTSTSEGASEGASGVRTLKKNGRLPKQGGVSRKPGFTFPNEIRQNTKGGIVSYIPKDLEGRNPMKSSSRLLAWSLYRRAAREPLA